MGGSLASLGLLGQKVPWEGLQGGAWISDLLSGSCRLWFRGWEHLWEKVCHSPAFPLAFSLSVSRWVTEEWGTCSRSCGKLGVQTRGVQCLLPLTNGTHKAMPAKACPGERPEARRPCLRVPCPFHWRTGAWSQVSCSQRVQGAGLIGAYPGKSRKRWVWEGELPRVLVVHAGRVSG